MAITNAQQYKQLVNPPLDGKRPGYRGDAAAKSSGAKSQGRVGGSDVGESSTRSDPRDDRPQEIIGGQSYDVTPENRKQREDLREEQRQLREIEKKKFIYEPANYPGYVPGYVKFLANLNREPNRRYFVDKVLKGKNAISLLTKSLGLDPEDQLSFSPYDLTEEQFEKAYQDYMTDRMSGKTDAMGNINPSFGRDDGPDQPIIPIIPEPVETVDPGEGEDDNIVTNPLAYRFMADGGRAAFRIGSDSGKDTSGRDYASNTAASRSVATSPSRDTGGGRDDNNNQPPQKISVPKPIKDAGNTAGELMFLKNVFELNPVGIMKNIGTKMFLDKLISDADTQQDQNMMLADVSAMDLKRKNQFKNLDYGTAMDIGIINPTMTQEEFEGVKSGEITEPTGQFARDGGRIGAMDGGIMDADIVGGMMDGNMDEMGRQMYGLGKLVKKATRAVKKIAKSPIGKAALLYTGAGALGNLAAGKGFASMFSGFTSPSTFLGRVPGIFSKGGLQNIASRIGLGKFKNVGGQRLFEASKLGSFLTSPAGLIAASSALPFLFKGDEEEEFDPYRGPDIDIAAIRRDPYGAMGGAYRFAADGGIMRPGYQEGGDAEPVAKKTMPLIDMDGKEKDYRETGGFVDMGRMERADDVPARLSKNEFVFTADAVRNAGDGDIDKGAEVMYNMMKNLEAGGEVSEESQGLEGARKMFQTSQRLEEVL